MRLKITNGHVLNPATGMDGIADVLIEDGVISAIGEKATEASAEEVIDATGCFVAPGLIDLHVHFRDPGQTEKGDVETESKAAVRGGFTTVCAMPNTKPVADSVEITKYVEDKAKEIGLLDVIQVGSLTMGMEGKELSHLDEMISYGTKAFSEDGKSVMNSRLFRDAMRKTAAAGVPILDHCEDIDLVEGGVLNDGETAKRLGLRGIANDVENIIEARDMMIAEELDGQLHLCHCSTKESVELLRDAKKKGIRVTAEVCPHHFLLCEEDIPSDDANYKMNPPLRKREDMEALRQGLIDGVIDVISTDHAPHTAEEKSRGIEKAPFGIVGIETSLALSYTGLVKTGRMSALDLMERMSHKPAEILHIDKGDLSVGKAADIVIFDGNEKYEIHGADFVGKSKNMPYEGREVYGRVKATIYGGRISYRENI